MAFMIAERPLGWIPDIDDTPLTLTAETGGSGDDLRVEIAASPGVIELQAKHGLRGEKAVSEVLLATATRQAGGPEVETVIIVDQGSSAWIASELGPHFQSRRAGRPDVLGARTRRILGRAPTLTRRLLVKLVHLDDHDAADRHAALAHAGGKLVDPGQVEQLWSALCAKGHELAAVRTRITRSGLVELLEAKQIRLRRPPWEQHVAERLDEVKAALGRGEYDVARVLLEALNETSIQGLPADLRARRLTQLGVVAYRTQRFDAAAEAWRRALDLQPSSAGPLCNLANLHRERGEPDQALALAERALQTETEYLSAWVQRLFALDALGKRDNAPVPPKAVASSAEYQVALAGLASEDERWDDARLHSLAAIQAEESIEAVLMRAMVLANAPAATREEERADQLTAERLLTDVLARIPSLAEPRRAYAFLLRAEARRKLGKFEESRADLEEAGAGGTFDPNRVRLLAIDSVRADRLTDALAILNVPEADEVPILVAFRAEVRSFLHDHEGARRDFDSALTLVESANASDADRLALVHLALELNEVGIAERVSDAIIDHSQPRAMAAKALIAFARAEWAQGLELFRKTVAASGEANQAEYLAIALDKLATAKQWDHVIAIVGEYGLRSAPNGAKKLAQALTESRRYSEVDVLVSELTGQDIVPPWAMRLRLHLAKLREDPGEGLSAIQQMHRFGDASSEILVDELRFLVLLDRHDEARVCLATVLAKAETLPPTLMAVVAELCALLGDHRRAAEIAFLAYRRAPLELTVVKALVRRLLPTTERETDPGVVSENSAATLVDLETEAERSVVILDRDDADVLKDEYRPSHPLALQLIGHAVGDEITVGTDLTFRRRYRIKEVLPAWVPALRDAMVHAEERFPDSPPVRRIHVGADPTIGAVAKIAHATQSRADFARKLIDQYAQGTLPLPMVAELLGVALPELIGELTRPMSQLPMYAAEGVGSEFHDAVSAIQKAKGLVLTLDALVGVDLLDLYSSVLGAAIPVMVPMSLVWSIQEFDNKVSVAIARGQSFLTLATDGTLRMTEADPDSLSQWRDRYRRMGAWVAQHAEKRSRPLSALEKEEENAPSVRDVVGRVPIDAMDLAADSGWVLYTDDLLIRRLARHERKCQGCSTVSVIEAFANRGILSPDQRLNLRLDQIVHRWSSTPVDAETLLAATKRAHRAGPDVLRLSLDRCIAPYVPMELAVAIAAQTCRLLALEPLQGLSPAGFIARTLEVYATRWNHHEIARALRSATNRTLALLPTVRDSVSQALTT